MRKLLLVIGLSLIVFSKKGFVLLLIAGGLFIAPEASQILRHYCFGNGDTLLLDSSYIKKSDVVLNKAKKLRVGQNVKNHGFKQKEDWRLSYALNPFTVKRTKKEYIVQQWIQFDTTGKVRTNLNLFLFKIPVYDGMVHTYDCTPFLVMTKFKSLK
jgi:hypothetical protein